MWKRERDSQRKNDTVRLLGFNVIHWLLGKDMELLRNPGGCHVLREADGLGGCPATVRQQEERIVFSWDGGGPGGPDFLVAVRT